MLEDGSTIKTKLTKEDYKKINECFPLIEGYLFKKLDEVLVLLSLEQDVSYTMRAQYITNYPMRILAVNYRGFYARLVLDPASRRIGLEVSSKLAREKIYKALNISEPDIINKQWWCHYDFKYNHKNCNRLIDMIKFLTTIDVQSKGIVRLPPFPKTRKI